MGLLYIPVSLGLMARDGAGDQWPRVVLFSMAGCGVCVGFLWLGGVGGTPPLLRHSEVLRSCFACM